MDDSLLFPTSSRKTPTNSPLSPSQHTPMNSIVPWKSFQTHRSTLSNLSPSPSIENLTPSNSAYANRTPDFVYGGNAEPSVSSSSPQLRTYADFVPDYDFTPAKNFMHPNITPQKSEGNNRGFGTLPPSIPPSFPSPPPPGSSPSGSYFTVPGGHGQPNSKAFQPTQSYRSIDDSQSNFWIVVNGFLPEEIHKVYLEFQDCGSIVEVKRESDTANWIFIKFDNEISAANALLKDGKRISPTSMIGVRRNGGAQPSLVTKPKDKVLPKESEKLLTSSPISSIKNKRLECDMVPATGWWTKFIDFITEY